MISAEAYLDHIRRDGERIIEVAENDLDKPVPTCPGNTVESLLMHAAGVLIWWTAALEQNREPDPDWSRLSGDMLKAYSRALPLFIQRLSSHAPDQPTWTWGQDQHARFVYRRVAQELSVHRWDFENAVGRARPIDPALAADGVDELFDTFTDAPPQGGVSAAQRFGGGGERLRLEATDMPRAWTITATPDRFDVSDEGTADVEARGTASDIDLFVWGRVPPDAFEVTGDAGLLSRWQERVKI